MARLKEGIRRFKGWAVVALVIIAFLALFLLRHDPITVKLVDRSNISGTPHAIVEVVNHSRNEFAVLTHAVVNGELRGFDANLRPIPLQLAPGTRSILSVPLAGSGPARFRFVCLTPEPPHTIQRFFMRVFALLHLRYPDPWRFETDLVVSE
jgi:hypothetical protein